MREAMKFFPGKMIETIASRRAATSRERSEIDRGGHWRLFPFLLAPKPSCARVQRTTFIARRVLVRSAVRSHGGRLAGVLAVRQVTQKTWSRSFPLALLWTRRAPLSLTGEGPSGQPGGLFTRQSVRCNPASKTRYRGLGVSVVDAGLARVHRAVGFHHSRCGSDLPCRSRGCPVIRL
jgi:hypothetical protein